MKKLDHVSKIYSSYDTFIIDLWGVIHNGISLNKKAMEVVKNLTLKSKKIVFLSNAPRPSLNVKEFLMNMKMEEKYLKNIVTSGEAAMSAINQNRFGKFFFHLGPDRDEPIFKQVKKNQTSIEKSEFILCTGLFDEHEGDLDYYKNLLKDHLSKKLVCTNPDLTVHEEIQKNIVLDLSHRFLSLWERLYILANHIKRFTKCVLNQERVLAIGDNLRTDIKGANNLKIDSYLF